MPEVPYGVGGAFRSIHFFNWLPTTKGKTNSKIKNSQNGRKVFRKLKYKKSITGHKTTMTTKVKAPDFSLSNLEFS